MTSPTVTAAISEGARTSELHWSVTVELNGKQVITIAHNFLAGDPSPNEEAIRTAAHNLLAFIGDPHPDAPAPHASVTKEMLEAGDLFLTNASFVNVSEAQREQIYLAMSAAAQHAVLAGWKMVPVEPTNKMMLRAQSTQAAASGIVVSKEMLRESYRGMLAASPTPPDSPLAKNPNTIGRVATALSMFVSVIKSGESWSPECDTARKEAYDALSVIGNYLSAPGSGQSIDAVNTLREVGSLCRNEGMDGRKTEDDLFGFIVRINNITVDALSAFDHGKPALPE